MITVCPTKNLLGVTIQGDYNDFSELVESIYRITTYAEKYGDIYYAVSNRLLAICYDIRHAYQGDREVALKDNGMNKELMEWHDVKASCENVYYSCNVFFPQAIFVAFSANNFCNYLSYYSKRNHDELFEQYPVTASILDKANIDMLCAGIYQALEEVIGKEEMKKLLKLKNKEDEYYINYLTQFIDKCDMDLLKTSVDKRASKIKTIARGIACKPKSYYDLEYAFKIAAKEQNVSIYELCDSSVEYPEEIEW